MSDTSVRSLILCSWNVNGLRSLGLPLKPVLDQLDADVICLQEVKTSADLGREWACVDGYNAYFNHCTSKSGYSGVAIYCREPLKPVNIFDSISKAFHSIHTAVTSATATVEPFDSIITKIGLSSQDVRQIDAEGRFLAAVFPPASNRQLVQMHGVSDRPVIVVSVYVPRADPNEPKRVMFRTQFERLFTVCVDALSSHHCVIICGDFNVYHTSQDVCEPEIISTELACLPSRQWINSLLITEQRDPQLDNGKSGESGPTFVDSFRYLNPQTKDAFTCWSTRTGARATNYGVRIDYILVDSSLVTRFDNRSSMKVDHLTNVKGSDHCPVRVHLPLTLSVNPSSPYPSACSRFWPQCQSKQINLKPFIMPISPPTIQASDTKLSTVAHKRVQPPGSNNVIKKRTMKQTTLFVASRQNESGDTHSIDVAPPSPTFDGVIAPETATLLEITFQADAEKASKAASAWQNLLSGPKKAPLCKGHMEPCVLRAVKRSSTTSGSRRGRRFWVCARPQGTKDNPAARCDTFLWDDQYNP